MYVLVRFPILRRGSNGSDSATAARAEALMFILEVIANLYMSARWVKNNLLGHEPCSNHGIWFDQLVKT